LSEHGPCNASTIEGFAGPAAHRRIAQNIRAAGGVLYAMEMEHGFDAATYYDTACRMTPAEIAHDAARTVAAVREVFPEAVIGSIETGNLNVDDIASWVSAYRDATGEELGFFHLDIPYFIPDWAARAKAIETYIRSRGIAFGLYYAGDPDDTSDEQWVGRAEQRFVEYEVGAGGQPDHAIFQSWNSHPVSLLPEDQPGTFTWLIARYLRARTSLAMDVSEGIAAGLLTGTNGEPVGGSTLEVSVTPIHGTGVFTDYTITGVVPASATTADVGLRINTECDCSGPAALVLAGMDYREQGASTNRVPNGGFVGGLTGWGIWGAGQTKLGAGENGVGYGLHVDAAASQDVGVNSEAFAVTPGQPFTLTFRARIDPPTASSGYFDIVFLSGAAESKRFTIPIRVAVTPLGSIQTGPDGSFVLPLGRLPAGTVRLRAWFDGSESLWPATAVQDIGP
jgi:hypothetical protein